MIFAQPRALLPAIGAVMIGGGEATVGILLASTAVGAFLAGLFSGPLGARPPAGGRRRLVRDGLGRLDRRLRPRGCPRRRLRRRRRDVCGCCPRPCAARWPGIADSVSAVFRTTILQASTPDHLRGRLQGVFIVVVAGGPRVGDMLAGGGTKILSEGWVLLLGGVLCIAVAWAVAHCSRAS